MVFRPAEIDGRLPSNCRIHHGEQSGRHIDELDTAFVGGSSESAQVGDGTTAEIDNQGVTVGMVLHQGFPDALDSLKVFLLLSWFDNDVDRRFAMQPMGYLGQPEWGHILVRQDEYLRGFCYGLSQVTHCQSKPGTL